MRLTSIDVIEGTIELRSGLHIGTSDTEMSIGGIDNPIAKHPITGIPYIPGSSIKGKIRSLLEWHAGVVALTNGAPLNWEQAKKAPDQAYAKAIVKLFGNSADARMPIEEAKELGPTRLSFWDCPLTQECLQNVQDKGLPITEEKSENSIDRISSVATNPRFTERVPSGAEFDFKVTLKRISEDPEGLIKHLHTGLKLLELDGLGGSGSRGYGKIRFTRLAIAGEDIIDKVRSIDLSD